MEEVRSEIAEREEENEMEEGEEGEEGEEEEVAGVLEGDRLLRLGIDDLSDALEVLQTVSAEERGAQAKLARKLATSLSTPQAPTATAEIAAGATEAGVTLPRPRPSAHPTNTYRTLASPLPTP